MSEIVFKAIYINLNDHIYICYAKRNNREICYSEGDPYDKINCMFDI